MVGLSNHVFTGEIADHLVAEQVPALGILHPEQ
jgi:hypothetical protein